MSTLPPESAYGGIVLCRGRDPHDAQERPEGHRDAGAERDPAGPTGAGAGGGGTQRGRTQVPDLDVLLRELVGEEPEAGEDGGPAVGGRGQVEDLDLEDVAGLGTLDVDGTEGRVGEGEVEGLEGRGFVVRADLGVAAVFEVEGDLGTGGDGQGRRYGVVPF